MTFYASLRVFLTQIFHDDNLQLLGSNLIRADLPSNTERRGVCISYQNFLPLKLINIECLTYVIKLDKICNFVSLYRSPNQSEDNFENFCDNFELNLDALSAINPFLIVAICDFHGKYNNWFTGDARTSEGSKIEAVTSQFGLQQSINEPNHIKGKSASCINLIFAYQPYLVMGSRIHSSLHKIAIIS